MTATTKTTLRSYFNTGDIPTETQFTNLIDTIGLATLTVAASDASDASKGRADYVCDGVNDEVQIQAAIDALPSVGGRVLLSEGNYNLYTAGQVEAHGPQYYCVLIDENDGAIVIEGIPEATKLKLADNQTSSTAMILVHGTSQAVPRTAHTNIVGLSFDYNGANQPFPPDRDYASSVILQYSGYTDIRKCSFTGNTDWAIWIVYVSLRNRITDCYFTGDCGGIRGEGNDSIITNNIFNMNQSTVNTFCTAISLAPDSDELYPGGGTWRNFGWCITGNLIQGGLRGIQMGDACAAVISGNVFTRSTGNIQIELLGWSNHNVIIGNTFYNNGNINIQLRNEAEYNIIAENIFIAGQDRQPEWAIKEETGSPLHNNYIINNYAEAGTQTIVVTSGGGSIVRGNIGYPNESCGTAALVADGGTIDHGLVGTPVWANVTPSISNEFVSVTALDATHITVAIKKHDGSAGTTQTLYWEAKMQDAISA